MNKQEAIEELEYLKRLLEEGSKDNYKNGFINALKYTLNVVKQLKEQEKPKVPQFVADWYEENKDDFEDGVYDFCVQFSEERLNDDLYKWFCNGDNKPIQTLVNMHQFGYEVEKEKLYIVEIPNPNGGSNRYGLYKVDSRIIIGRFVFDLSNASNAKLTEAEIKEDFEWAWQWAKEVEDDTKI